MVNRSKVRTQRAKRIRHFSRSVQYQIQNHRVASVVIAWIAAGVLDGIAESMVDINQYLDKPFLWLSQWNPTSPLFRWIDFSALMLLLLGGPFLLWQFFKRMVNKSSPFIYPSILYEEELSSAVEALDNPDTEKHELQEKMEDLILSVAETVTVTLGLTSSNYRAYVIAGSADGVGISWFRFGRQFERAQRKHESVERILSADEELVIRMCQRRKTVSVMRSVQEEYPDSDIHTMIMIRNPGDFRLGLLIAVINPSVQIEVDDSTFLQASYIMRMLGFIDKLVEFVLEYEKEGEDNDE